MVGIFNLYREFRHRLQGRKSDIAPLQVISRLEEYLSKEFARAILTGSNGELLPVTNFGRRPDKRKIDIPIARRRLVPGTWQEVIQGCS